MSETARTNAETTGAPGSAIGTRRWMALVVLCVGQLMIVLDVTVVNVALPTIQRELHFSQSSLAWVVNAYLLAFGGLMLLAGRLGDLMGRKRVFLVGVAAFTVASLLCGLANDRTELVIARFVQGTSAALMASMILGILVTMFRESGERARAMAVYAFVASSGGSIGLLLGGVLTEALNWHWIFFINIPIGIATFLLGWTLIEGSEGLGFAHGVDVLGGVLAVAAPTLAVYTIVNASGWGWGSGRTIGFAVVTILLVAAFLVTEARVKNPLMPLAIFESRTRSVGNAIRALFAVGLFGAFFLGALYLQHILGFSAIETGLAFLPSTVTVGLFSLGVTARVMSRIGPRATLIPGLVCAGLALLLFARMPVGGTYAIDVLPGMLLFGIGGGLAVLASVSATVTSRLIGTGTAAPNALTSGFHVAFLIGAGCQAVSLILAVTLLPRMATRAVERGPQPSAEAA